MPVCFQLSRKISPVFTPVKLSLIDEEICDYFGVEPDDKQYFRYWVDIEGFALACGKSFDWMRENHDPDRRAIIDWLDENFNADSWRE